MWYLKQDFICQEKKSTRLICVKIQGERGQEYHNLQNPYIQSPSSEVLCLQLGNGHCLGGCPNTPREQRTNIVAYYTILASHNVFLYYKVMILLPSCSLRRFFSTPAAYQSFGKSGILEVGSTCHCLLKSPGHFSQGDGCVIQDTGVLNQFLGHFSFLSPVWLMAKVHLREETDEHQILYSQFVARKTILKQ